MNAGRPPEPPPAGNAARRYFVVARDIAPVGYDALDAAVEVARNYGEGTDIVDTLATPYHPMVQRIVNGAPSYLDYGAWPTRGLPDQNLIEAVKKGHPSIVSAFLAKGVDVNQRDSRGGTALIWAVARRVPDCVQLLIAAGAEVNARDRDGMSALKLARSKSLSQIETMLLGAGASEAP